MTPEEQKTTILLRAQASALQGRAKSAVGLFDKENRA